MNESIDPVEPEAGQADGRREFLKKCGKFAVITPPAVSFLLSTSLSSKAIAASSGGSRPGWGHGDTNHDHVGPPGLSKKNGGSGASSSGNGNGHKK
ncbi:hypothetical protein OMW55_04760 [Sphingomonas sp. BN140010]|uniref:Uncharacterized protein n=1 Tax=Sphingomonas arvum TaxID=2992113 RepID=A0ABT3JDG3_9SPHN|nr:hypothetical protein [Sphingomonas sp. BN140010]MCW3797117.1 hypothetical protein [Sphingomonas sp. BN140010]